MKGDVKILAGNFDVPPNTAGNYSFGYLSWGGIFAAPQLNFFSDVAKLEVQTEESIKSFAGTAGWAVAGALVAGPVGALIGGILGGRGNRVCFLAHLRDGRQILASTDTPTFNDMQAAVLKGNSIWGTKD